MGALAESLERVFRATAEDKAATARQVKEAVRGAYSLVERMFRSARETAEERRGAVNIALAEVSDRVTVQQERIDKIDTAVNNTAQILSEQEPRWKENLEGLKRAVTEKLREHHEKIKRAMDQLDSRCADLLKIQLDTENKNAEISEKLHLLTMRLTIVESREDVGRGGDVDRQEGEVDDVGRRGDEDRQEGEVNDVGRRDDEDRQEGEVNEEANDEAREAEGNGVDETNQPGAGGDGSRVGDGMVRQEGVVGGPVGARQSNNIWVLNHAERMMSSFSGNGEEVFSEWSTRLRDHLEYAADADMTEQRKLGFLKSKLTGRARRAFEGLDNANKATLDLAIAGLETVFARLQTPRAALARLHEYPSLTPGRKLLDFAEKLETLVQRAFPTKTNEFRQERLYEEFTRRLPHEMKGQVLQANPATYAEALELAAKLEFHESTGGQNGAQQVAAVVQDEMSSLRQQLKDLRSELQGVLQERANPPRRLVGGVITCYRCGFQGHISRDCPRGGITGANAVPVRTQFTRAPGAFSAQNVERAGLPRQVNNVAAADTEEERLRRHVAALEAHNDRLMGEIEAQSMADTDREVMHINELRQRPADEHGRPSQGPGSRPPVEKGVRKRMPWWRSLQGILYALIPHCVMALATGQQLMICQKDTPQTVVQLPDALSCPSIAGHQWSTEPTDITIFKPSAGRTNFSAVMCTCVRQKASYWTTLENEHRQNVTEEALPVDDEECRRMWKKRTSPSGQMARVGELLRTSNQLQFDFPWPVIGSFTTRYTETANCFAHEVVLWHSTDSSQLHTVVGDARECRIEEGRCHLEGGAVLVWEGRKHQVCNYEVLGSWRGFSGNRTWITKTGEFLLSFQRDQVINDCERILVVSDQGFAISQEAARRLVVATRARRSHSGLVQSEQLAAQLAAVNEAAINRLVTLSGAACEARNLGWTALLSTVVLQPTISARRFLRQEFVQAEALTANVLRLWPCHAILPEQWQPRTTTECTIEFPVMVNLGAQTLEVYADMTTGIISHVGTRVNCELTTPWKAMPGREKEFNQITGATRVMAVKAWKPAHSAEALGTAPLPTTFHDLILTEVQALLPLDNVEQALREARVQAEVQRQLGKTAIGHHLKTGSPASLVRQGRENSLPRWRNPRTRIQQSWLTS